MCILQMRKQALGGVVTKVEAQDLGLPKASPLKVCWFYAFPKSTPTVLSPSIPKETKGFRRKPLAVAWPGFSLLQAHSIIKVFLKILPSLSEAWQTKPPLFWLLGRQRGGRVLGGGWTIPSGVRITFHHLLRRALRSSSLFQSVTLLPIMGWVGGEGQVLHWMWGIGHR